MVKCTDSIKILKRFKYESGDNDSMVEKDVELIYVSKVIETICNEGQNKGEPVLQISVNKEKKKKKTIKQLVDIISKTHKGLIYWTGDDPMDYGDQISEIINKTKFRDHQVKTNAKKLHPVLKKFDYICFVPKTVADAEHCLIFLKKFVDLYWHVVDIMVETDLEDVNKELLGYASMLMSSSDDKKIKQKVWKYCIKHNLRYNAR